ncbi:Arm DNA-binding domain-containing protein [Leptolyngbya sp. KIOST-1]|uniref:Arm DNA-binding domain-containing protein n=1 Tax=Leptolyngbya sp. KIOST-1 TaxID=1229172 RepID=UPI00068D406D|nr:DUF3596 domain-containing protein [Leptolyngbya sp. KIOST-1]
MAKGQVKVEVYSERLRLRWSYRSQRYCLSVGLPDSIINRRVATQKAQQIELDMLSGNFDPTLQKYKPEDPLPMVVAGSETSQLHSTLGYLSPVQFEYNYWLSLEGVKAA